MNIAGKLYRKYTSLRHHIIYSGITLGLLYLLLDTIIHAHILHKDAFSGIFPLLHSMNELWLRFLVLAVFIAFSVYAQSIVNNRKKAEDRLRKSENLLRSIAEHISAKTGEEYFMSVAEFISCRLGTEYTIIGRLNSVENKVVTIVLYAHGKFIDNIEYSLKNTPCENVVGKEACLYASNIRKLFPEDKLLVEMNAESYAGIPLFDSDGKPIGLIATLGCSPMNEEVRDEHVSILQIFASRAAAEMERQSYLEELKKFKLISDHSNNSHLLLGREGRFLYVNRTACKMLGYPEDEFLKLTVADIVSLHNLEQYRELFDKARHETLSPIETACRRKDGTEFPAEVILSGYRMHGKQYLFASLQDISVRKQAENALLESEARFKGIVDNINIGVSLISPDLELLLVNNQIMKWFPDIRLEGTPICHIAFRYFLEEGVCNKCPASKTLRDGRVHELKADITIGQEVRNYRIVSSPIRNAGGKILSVIEIMEDMTEHRKLEEQIFQVQKMESIGTLAGGIAHDFNNIITAIIGFVSVLQRRISKDDPSRLYVEQIHTAADNAASLTNRLLTFSRKQKINPSTVDLNDIIRKFEKFFIRLLGEDIEFRLSLTEKKLNVLADCNQMEQVLLNLAGNARDAMPHGGRLSLSTHAIRFDEAFIKMHGFGKPGDYAVISLSDSGTGFDDKTREKIFEPFFTTKDVDKGTGLGLSIIYGIIKQHHGYIDVDSEPGRGTSFSVYLPLIRKTEQYRSSENRTVYEPSRGTETLLVAEDNKMILELITSVLKEYGYQVIPASNGEEAVNKFRKNKDSIDFVVSDVMMPEKNGRELYYDIIRTRPDLKILFISGYSQSLIQGELLGENINLLPKPVKPDELLVKIREMLDSG